MKKLIAIVVAIFALRLLLQAQQAQQQQDQQNQEAQKAAEEAAKKQAEEQEKARAQALKQIEINTFVSNWYTSYNSYLPVYADDWRGFAETSKEDWPMVKKAMKDLGFTYKSVWERIEYWSSPFFHTGFYKGEFDSIRDQLKTRTNW